MSLFVSESIHPPSNLSYYINHTSLYISWSPSLGTAADHYSEVDIVAPNANYTHTTNETVFSITLYDYGEYTVNVQSVTCKGQVVSQKESLHFELKGQCLYWGITVIYIYL